MKELRSILPNELKDFDVWEKEKELYIRDRVEMIIKGFRSEFPQTEDA